MPGKRLHSSDCGVPGEHACKARRRRLWGLVLVCVVSALSGGCLEPIPLQQPPRLPDTLSVPQAQQLLKETLFRALNPQIRNVEVTDDFVIYYYSQVVAGYPTGALLENRIALLNIGRVDAFSNNIVQIWTPSHLLLGQLAFGNYRDPKMCANLLLFLRDRRASRG
jgi:hypothetical protein